jgi:hypothetical protein
MQPNLIIEDFERAVEKLKDIYYNDLSIDEIEIDNHYVIERQNMAMESVKVAIKDIKRAINRIKTDS